MYNKQCRVILYIQNFDQFEEIDLYRFLSEYMYMYIYLLKFIIIYFFLVFVTMIIVKIYVIINIYDSMLLQICDRGSCVIEQDRYYYVLICNMFGRYAFFKKKKENIYFVDCMLKLYRLGW